MSRILLPSNSIPRPGQPLPIDWEVPTCGFDLAINGTGHEIGFFDIEHARFYDFIQPAIFDEDIEIWPPGSLSEIGWLYWKGDPYLRPPTPQHPFEGDFFNSFYNIDLINAEKNILRNVMRRCSLVVLEWFESWSEAAPTNTSVFWGSIGPGDPDFDGIHEVSGWPFTSNRSCKYYQFSLLVFIWEVPRDLDPIPTYRLRLTVNGSDDEHISGPFRLQPNAHELERLVDQLGNNFIFVVILVTIGALLASIILWLKRSRVGRIRLPESNRGL